ncbi:helix-turn-helix domain-containing protein [Lentzea sp. NPDC003310]|uniref:helix-turn-helix domain-containing protein n=1 Tax=Lentzea sp. NPDC003310 TaxID=3154447 RepID=UPI0033B8E819
METPAATEEHAATVQLTVASTQALFTPAQAAEQLQVRESWLRRRAARRAIPCTFLGKHLRFSHDDIKKIVAAAAQAPNLTSTKDPLHRRTNSKQRARNEHI